MADIEIGTLSDRLGDDEIAQVKKELKKLGGGEMVPGDESVVGTLLGDIDNDVMTEFLDRLEAYDVACDIYLPVEFDGRFEIGELRIGSVVQLSEMLEELKEELEVEDDDAEEEEDDDAADADDEDEDEDETDADKLEEKMRDLWKVVWDGAQTALDKRVVLYIKH
jgi:hypothetical protein